MTVDTPTPGTDLVEAGDMLAELLNEDLDTNTPADDEADENAEADEAEGDDDASDTSDETADGDEGEEDDEAAEDDDTTEDDADAKPKTITVKIDGKEVEVPVEEAAAGYQRHADYTRKTTALAQERQAFETERNATKEERGQYKQVLGALVQRIKDFEPQEPDWPTLYATDKTEYAVQWAQWESLRQQRAAAEAELQRVHETEMREYAVANNQRVQHAAAVLLDWEPRWKDEATRKKDIGALQQYAKEVLQYSDAELAQATDPRAILAVHKARLYDELVAKATKLKSKARKSTNKSLPAGSASNKASQSKSSRSQSNAKQRLARSGSVEDAGDLIANLI